MVASGTIAKKIQVVNVREFGDNTRQHPVKGKRMYSLINQTPKANPTWQTSVRNKIPSIMMLVKSALKLQNGIKAAAAMIESGEESSSPDEM